MAKDLLVTTETLKTILPVVKGNQTDAKTEAVQSDWNQNDPNALDYIKNRICYDEREIFCEGSIIITEDGPYKVADSIYEFLDNVPSMVQDGEILTDAKIDLTVNNKTITSENTMIWHTGDYCGMVVFGKDELLLEDSITISFHPNIGDVISTPLTGLDDLAVGDTVYVNIDGKTYVDTVSEMTYFSGAIGFGSTNVSFSDRPYVFCNAYLSHGRGWYMVGAENATHQVKISKVPFMAEFNNRGSYSFMLITDDLFYTTLGMSPEDIRKVEIQCYFGGTHKIDPKYLPEIPSSASDILLSNEFVKYFERGKNVETVLGSVTEDVNYIKEHGIQLKTNPITLRSTNWLGTRPYEQNVTINGISADETLQLITIAPAGSNSTIYYNCGILCARQSENQLTFTSEIKPSSDILVYVIIQEVS